MGLVKRADLKRRVMRKMFLFSAVIFMNSGFPRMAIINLMSEAKAVFLRNGQPAAMVRLQPPTGIIIRKV